MLYGAERRGGFLAVYPWTGNLFPVGTCTTFRQHPGSLGGAEKETFQHGLLVDCGTVGYAVLYVTGVWHLVGHFRHVGVGLKLQGHPHMDVEAGKRNFYFMGSIRTGLYSSYIGDASDGVFDFLYFHV